MGDFVVNIVHRPEMAPEYAEKVTGHGRAEDIARKSLLEESLDIFRLQQDTAHKYGLKTTIQMTYGSLFVPESVRLAKDYNARFGDEIALSLLGLPCKPFRDKYKTRDFCIWMFPWEVRTQIIDDVFAQFHQAFGFYPASTGSYYLDADTIAYIKAKYPGVQAVIATCWEEGPKAFRTCNNSWYTWMDGGPWNPWIPSRVNSHAPARDAQDDSGVVAIPHLSRDLMACYDGNGSNFGTHPQNVLRGMCYQYDPDPYKCEYPYFYNLVDQYRHLGAFNGGQAYNMMFVGPGWLNQSGRWEASFELLRRSYDDGMAYYGRLKREGKCTDMTMAEYAAHYRRTHEYGQPECALWRDILCGSDKQLFWYIDPDMRACVNLDEGGALVDLRPYAARLSRPVGIGTPRVHDASFPFLIQEKYRSGYFTHYVGEGSIRSAKVCWRGEEADLCLCRARGRVEADGGTVRLVIDPVEIAFDGLTLWLQTVYAFRRGSARIHVSRQVTDISDPAATITLCEYLTGCYGTTEYPEDMKGVTLTARRGDRTQTIAYDYRCREIRLPEADAVSAVIPAIHTCVALEAAGDNKTGVVREGYAFSPMYTLGYDMTITGKGRVDTWLRLQRAD